MTYYRVADFFIAQDARLDFFREKNKSKQSLIKAHKAKKKQIFEKKIMHSVIIR